LAKRRIEVWKTYQEYINGLSFEEIAEKYDISARTVKQHIIRSKDQL